MPAWKWGLLLLAAALLPSCSRGRPHWVRVTVTNEGTGSAEIQSRAEYSAGMGGWEESLDLTVSSSQSIDFSFKFDNLIRLHVWIDRSTDNLNLFDHSWDWHELEDLDKHVIIAVSP